jgi:hypothetical protein
VNGSGRAVDRTAIFIGLPGSAQTAPDHPSAAIFAVSGAMKKQKPEAIPDVFAGFAAFYQRGNSEITARKQREISGNSRLQRHGRAPAPAIAREDVGIAPALVKNIKGTFF